MLKDRRPLTQIIELLMLDKTILLTRIEDLTQRVYYRNLKTNLLIILNKDHKDLCQVACKNL